MKIATYILLEDKDVSTRAKIKDFTDNKVDFIEEDLMALDGTITFKHKVDKRILRI